MSYTYRNINSILESLTLSRLPLIGPALCDIAEGDEVYAIPHNLNDFYIPFYGEYMAYRGADYPIFFGELQPETEWVDFDGRPNQDNRWYSYIPPKDKNAVFGLHISIKPCFAGSTDETQIRYTLNNRRAVIDFGERIGVKYYVIHVSQDGFVGSDANFQSVIHILYETVKYLAEKQSKAYILIENLEYPKYPATPAELAWWYDKIREFDTGGKLNFGVLVDVAHLWKSRGDIINIINSGGSMPDWIMQEKDIIFQPYHDLLNYTLKTKLDGIPVIAFHLGGCYGHETHLIPGMRINEDPDQTEISVYRFYDENVEMNLKNTIKYIVQCYIDSQRGVKELNAENFRPLYIVTESYISHHSHTKHSLRYPSVLKGIKAVRDYLVQYMEKLYIKSQNRVRVYDFFRK